MLKAQVSRNQEIRYFFIRIYNTITMSLWEYTDSSYTQNYPGSAFYGSKIVSGFSLIGETINKVSYSLKKQSGTSPTYTIYCKIFNSSNTEVSSGSINASELGESFALHEFEMSPPHELADGDYIFCNNDTATSSTKFHLEYDTVNIPTGINGWYQTASTFTGGSAIPGGSCNTMTIEYGSSTSTSVFPPPPIAMIGY